MNYEEGMNAVNSGFKWEAGQRFIIYHARGPKDKTVSGGGYSTVPVIYGEYIHPDLDDPYTQTCYQDFIRSN